MKVLIVGGVAGGATAAARLRRLDEKAEIIVLERSGYVSYANCGLPYYIGGVIQEQNALTLQTPESFWARFRIDVRVRNEVVAIDSARKTVSIRKLEIGEVYEESYDKLILSPGAKAVKPSLPGIDLERVFTVRTVEDTLRARAFVEAQKPQRAVVVGGGFIGLEMAENLTHMGVSVTVVEKLNQVMSPIDYDMACSVHGYLKSKGITLRLGQSVSGFAEEGNGLSVTLEDETVLQADLVVLAIGVTPDTQLAKDAGLALGIRGSIAVNERMETSVPNIYAVGDAVEVVRYVTGEKALVPLAGPANKQGRIAADNICGKDSRYKGSLGTSVLKLFDMTIAAAGINETMAKNAGISYDKAVTFSAAHATYYPGATNMTIKTLFDPKDGRILGAQIVGFEGVDKRIDVLASAIRAKMDAWDLQELELSYAPPYSSAKDPVNMAGFVIGNLLDGTVKQYHWPDVPALQKRSDVILLDTRTAEEYSRGHIEGTCNIPLDELRERLGELDKAKTIYVNCQSGLRSYIACRILMQNGFDCYNFSGGYRFYEIVAKDGAFDETPAHGCGIKI
ncbi:MAG: FAD-dependent oxidoreductase [Oscillospiraceae bacterium]|jgi:NADPH-dependent 2,4-dienoyl-CoA reductase/sulfur reductase-like enzyme/rhodanese-related sulfurtransferase